MSEELKSPLLSTSLSAPLWAQDMARKYASSALSLFILHGNVLDLVAYESGGKKSFDSLPDFLTNVFFARRGLVLTYDLSNGIQCPKPEMRQGVMSMVRPWTPRAARTISTRACLKIRSRRSS
jgi:hypothetical protein